MNDVPSLRPLLTPTNTIPTHEQVLSRFSRLAEGAPKQRLQAFVRSLDNMKYDHSRTLAWEIMSRIESGEHMTIDEIGASIRAAA